MKEIEIRVSLHGNEYYQIEYRPKKKLNWFNPWRTLVRVWDGAYLNYDHPILIPDFDYAVEYAKKLKSNPELITEHYAEQDKIYQEAKKRREDFYNKKNKTITL